MNLRLGGGVFNRRLTASMRSLGKLGLSKSSLHPAARPTPVRQSSTAGRGAAPTFSGRCTPIGVDPYGWLVHRCKNIVDGGDLTSRCVESGLSRFRHTEQNTAGQLKPTLGLIVGQILCDELKSQSLGSVALRPRRYAPRCSHHVHVRFDV